MQINHSTFTEAFQLYVTSLERFQSYIPGNDKQRLWYLFFRFHPVQSSVGEKKKKNLLPQQCRRNRAGESWCKTSNENRYSHREPCRSRKQLQPCLSNPLTLLGIKFQQYRFRRNFHLAKRVPTATEDFTSRRCSETKEIRSRRRISIGTPSTSSHRYQSPRGVI